METITASGGRSERRPPVRVKRRLRGGPTVLVVDDDLDARTIFREYLRMVGCRVMTARDGLTGIEKAHKYHPAVVVMDLAMPRMDGWEAIAQLKASRDTARIPIIAVSAVQLSRDRARSAGCDAFIAKPCSPELLWWEVQLMLRSPLAV